MFDRCCKLIKRIKLTLPEFVAILFKVCRLDVFSDTSPGHPVSGCLGHARQAALPGHPDPGLGHRMFRSTEGGRRRSSPVFHNFEFLIIL